MIITLRPIDRRNRKAVLALSVREDQPFVAPNKISLKQADEANAEKPGTARPFGIYADERLVGFCMFAFDPENEDEDDRYYLWRFMIDQNEQGKGYGQAALQEIIRYFKERGADRLLLSTEPENARGLHGPRRRRYNPRSRKGYQHNLTQYAGRQAHARGRRASRCFDCPRPSQRGGGL